MMFLDGEPVANLMPDGCNNRLAIPPFHFPPFPPCEARAKRVGLSALMSALHSATIQ